MKRSLPSLGVLLLLGAVLAAQEQKPPTLTRPGDEEPGESPSLGGPHSANTNDAHKLLRIRSVFIGQIDNGLDEKLVEEIGQKGLFRVVADRRQADAVLSGTCLDSARLKSLHSEVYLTAPDGRPIWQEVVHERYKPPPLAQAVEKTAEVVVADLSASLREAQGR